MTDGTAGRGPIRWIYPIVGGIIAEAVTIALIAFAVAVTGHGGAGPAGEPIDPVADRIGAAMSASVGSLLCYFMGWWAARRAGGRFELHGALVGTTAAVLTVLGTVFGPSGQAVYYIVALIMKVVAAGAGGRQAARMAEG